MQPLCPGVPACRGLRLGQRVLRLEDGRTGRLPLRDQALTFPLGVSGLRLHALDLGVEADHRRVLPGRPGLVAPHLEGIELRHQVVPLALVRRLGLSEASLTHDRLLMARSECLERWRRSMHGSSSLRANQRPGQSWRAQGYQAENGHTTVMVSLHTMLPYHAFRKAPSFRAEI